MVESQCLVKTSISIDTEQYPNGLNSHLPRFRCYESPGMYIVTVLLLMFYLAAAGVQLSYNVNMTHVLLISAFLTPLPYLFRHYFDYMPNLFHQVFLRWACLIYNLIMTYFYFPVMDSIKKNQKTPFLVFSISPFFVVEIVLSIYALQSFKYFYFRHQLGAMRLRSFRTLQVINVLNMGIVSFSFITWLYYAILVRRYFTDSKSMVFVYIELIGPMMLHGVMVYSLGRISQILEPANFGLTGKIDLSNCSSDVGKMKSMTFSNTQGKPMSYI